MSDSENFLSRWARLKHESGLQRSGVNEKRTAGAEPAADVPPARAFDPANLPPIESIGADSDIRSFLQAGVPAELTRAALRSAWTADPAIRGFIGIAENQWDFNDAATIPGFGSLSAEDCARSLLARSLGDLDDASERATESSSTAEQPATTNSDPDGSKGVDESGNDVMAPGHSGQDADPGQHAVEQNVVESGSQTEASPEACVGPLLKRRHGSALPK
jgi:hypothetical protein